VKSLEDGFTGAGITGLPASAYERFEIYLDLLLRWNQRLSLTAVREPQQIIQRHFVESAFAAQKLPADIATLLDYGSGAGFPGIPIAICRPEISVTLAESQAKKASFLREVLRTLGVRAQVYAGRVEKMPAEDRFDAVTMRAVDRSELAMPFALARARHYVVLLTTGEPGMLSQETGADLKWWKPILLPNTSRSVLAIGERQSRV